MNVFRGVLLGLAAQVCAMGAVADDLSIKFQTQFSQEILLEVCSHKPIAREQIRKSKIVRDMVAHFGAMRSDFTMEHYLDARASAANCETVGNDIFRFRQVIDEKQRLSEAMDAIAMERDTFASEAARLIQPLMPSDLKYDGNAVLMVGTPSCGGWAVGATFYVDVPCLNGDQEGLLYLVAHEIYHGVQDQFMMHVDETAPPAARLLHEIIREGTAQNLVDFSEIKEPGKYAKLNQRILRTNNRRMRENFFLMDILFMSLSSASDGDQTYERSYAVGLSGMFDSPLYAVGDAVTKVLRGQYGDASVTCLMALPPQYFFSAYDQALQDGGGGDAPLPLGENTIRTLVALGTADGPMQNCISEATN